MKRKALGFVLILAIVMSFIPCVYAQTLSGWCGDYVRWELKDEEILTISGTGEMRDCVDNIISPWTNYNVKSIIIEDGVTHIGDFAFCDLINVENVQIADSVTDIGSHAFYDNRKLYDLKMSKNITRINEDAFYGCRNLNIIELPEKLEYIGRYAFSSCSSLNEIIIPDSVTTIEEAVFFGCKALNEVTIPAGVMYIGESAFAATQSLNIYVDENNSAYSSIDGVLFNKDATVLIAYSKDKEQPDYIIPDSVTAISDCAFEYCTFLTSLTIHKDVTDISERAFSGCGNLNISVSPLNSNYSDINGVLFNKDQTKIIAYTQDEINPNYIIPDSVEEIGSYAFYDCDKLQYIKVPSHVKKIGEYAFYYCIELKEIEIPPEITQIGQFTFYSCESLKILNIPDGIEEIGEYAFAFCSGVETILIPKSVKSIKRRAFTGGAQLTKIYYSGTQTDWENINIEEENYVLDNDIYYNSEQILKPFITSATVEKMLLWDGYGYMVNVSYENIPYSCYIVAAGYKDGVLVKISWEMAELQYLDKGLMIETDESQEIDEVKVFILDDLENIKPLCEAKSAEFVPME